MSDTPIFKLSDLTLDPRFLEDVISTLLNTIFNYRALGPVQINYLRCNKLTKITQWRCGEPAVDQDIAKLVSELSLLKEGKGLVISLKFFEEPTQYLLGLLKGKQRMFEEWQLHFKVCTSTVEKQTDELTNSIHRITELANANVDHFDENFDQSQEKPLKYPYKLSYMII